VDFGYTQEQEILRETIRHFALSEIAPHSLEWDERQYFPFETIKQLGEMGIMGVLVDPEWGGAGLGYLEYIIVMEELSRVDGSIALSVMAHNSLATNHIYLKGSQVQKKKYLRQLAAGEALGAWALTEPGAGSDAASARTRAIKKDGCWSLNGTKNFCTHGSCADIYVILAMTDPGEGKYGMSAFIAEKGTKGLTPGRKENKLGCRSMH
jgi:alkylation response protein AidB-like acyl-CoA dehydrogenase